VLACLALSSERQFRQRLQAQSAPVLPVCCDGEWERHMGQALQLICVIVPDFAENSTCSLNYKRHINRGIQRERTHTTHTHTPQGVMDKIIVCNIPRRTVQCTLHADKPQTAQLRVLDALRLHFNSWSPRHSREPDPAVDDFWVVHDCHLQHQQRQQPGWRHQLPHHPCPQASGACVPSEFASP
jgi:hypothetical protein